MALPAIADNYDVQAVVPGKLVYAAPDAWRAYGAGDITVQIEGGNGSIVASPVEGTDFVLDIARSGHPSVRFLVSDELLDTRKLILRRQVNPAHGVDIKNLDRLPAESLERLINQAFSALQDVRAEVSRAVRVGRGEVPADVLTSAVAHALLAMLPIRAAIEQVADIDADIEWASANEALLQNVAAQKDLIVGFPAVPYLALPSVIDSQLVRLSQDGVRYVVRAENLPYTVPGVFNVSDWLEIGAAGGGEVVPLPADVSFTGTFTNQLIVRGTFFEPVPLVVGLDGATAGFSKSGGSWDDVEFEVIQGRSRAGVERFGAGQIYIVPLAVIDPPSSNVFDVQVRARFPGQQWVGSDVLRITVDSPPSMVWQGDVPDQVVEVGNTLAPLSLVVGYLDAGWGFSLPAGLFVDEFGADWASVDMRIKQGGSRLALFNVGVVGGQVTLEGVSDYSEPGVHEVIVEARLNGGPWTPSAPFLVTVQAPAAVPTWNTPGPLGTISATRNVNVSQDFSPWATGADSFDVSGLPPGMSKTSASVISGAPAQVGTFSVQVTPRNSEGVGETRILTIVVSSLNFDDILLTGEPGFDLGELAP
ncbi:MAG: putative Ig domain-containing protein [Pseudomonadota bacterium]